MNGSHDFLTVGTNFPWQFIKSNGRTKWHALHDDWTGTGH